MSPVYKVVYGGKKGSKWTETQITKQNAQKIKKKAKK